MQNLINYNLRNVPQNVYKNALQFLTELQTIHFQGKARRSEDGSVITEFSQDLFDYENITFQVSGFMKQTKLVQKMVFFVTFFDQKDHKKIMKISRDQHSKITKLISDKISI